MSFMFTPFDFDDQTAVNHPQLAPEVVEGVVFALPQIVVRMADSLANAAMSQTNGLVVALDGYMGADFDRVAGLLTAQLEQRGCSVVRCDMQQIYRSKAALDAMLQPNLPMDDPDDPIHLFGRVFDGSYTDFLEQSKVTELLARKATGAAGQVMLLVGLGSSSDCIRPMVDRIAYIDMTSKQAAIRTRKGYAWNIGDSGMADLTQTMRRNYYVDFEVILKLRKWLLQNDKIDFYLAGSQEDNYAMMDAATLRALLRTMVNYPMRCKPVYMEGAWGGEYLRKVRNLPQSCRNIAWAYELIAFEVSLVIAIGEQQLELPFTTLIQQHPAQLMGEKCAKDFGGYFPIRFNYDDTYHGNGGLSIQVHPDEDYGMDNYNEKGAQDESYYIVVTGQGAKTFGGFQDGADPDEFLRLMRQSCKDGSKVDYLKYIHYVDSQPGTQVMIPSGTVHASGRNQLALEIGALTTGAYTYKMFDYNRKDLDGNLRPIHCNSAQRVVRKDRTSSWANQTIMRKPEVLTETEAYRELLIGKTEEMYFQTKQIDLESVYEAPNNGQFTVLALVDGEHVRVYSKANPACGYELHFLDIVVVPATITDYVIENLGYQPAVVHRTELRPDYQISQRQRERLAAYL